ncbi:hypothetical protein VP01_1236g3 [Puccinia sorghi]|uniref:Uncharacterized protein n=1 Tax=Puccinia sorghi TaxID=27349 RepID=A0A0L6VPZ2_9BASI|nr:hypothetical protein VP01_1236g3 [Puccinia sorghi]
MKFKRIGNRIFLTQPKHINRGLKELDLTEYKPTIGLLNYIASDTWPNLSFAVSSLACYSIKPVFVSLEFTIDLVKPSEFLSIFSNATWGDDPDSIMSQSVYLCYVLGSLISWNSCCQRSITYSSTKAELNPLVESFHEGLWLKALINEIWHLQIYSASYFIDNPKLIQQLTMDNKTFKERYCTNHLIEKKGLHDKLKKFGSNSKTHHINLRTKGLCQEIKIKNIKITLVKTQDMKADALTKLTLIEPLKNLTKTIDPEFSHQI